MPELQPQSRIAMSSSGWLVYLWNLRFLPLHIRWPILKFRRRLLNPESPLFLRYTARLSTELQHPPQRPLFYIARLLWPFPAWHFPLSVPGPPAEVLQRRQAIRERAEDFIHQRNIPLWRWRDTPQRSFYRMYEAVIVDEWPMLQYEVEYFWRHGDPAWATANLYDPAEDYSSEAPIDPVCHTIMAAIVEELVESFQWRLELGLRRRDLWVIKDQDKMPLVPENAPVWPSKVPGLPEMLHLQTCDDEDMAARETAKAGAFIRRNIFAFAGEFYTV